MLYFVEQILKIASQVNAFLWLSDSNLKFKGWLKSIMPLK